MPACEIHKDFFNETCKDCDDEYAELKGHTMGSNDNATHDITSVNTKKYKEFPEDRAKKLYEELLLQFLNSPYKLSEVEAASKARYIIKKQCLLRSLPIWQWLQ
ncbi:MAG TPA: hypothetical protein VF884_05030 [Nitrososphaeraceae archaeon]